MISIHNKGLTSSIEVSDKLIHYTWNKLQKEVSVFCSYGTTGNFRDPSKAQKGKTKVGPCVFYDKILSIIIATVG